ncbi:single-stranded DNA-binding protein [Clostridiaceae bacterium 14S0207]|nr:single-stranded DNA-binding protein [Clostridiaceae bacterium 14S0207]
MNKVTLIGRLTKDPELQFLAGNGTAVCKFNIAVNRKFKREGQPDADFIQVVVWGKMAEATANYMSKGRQIGISGRIETRNYEKDGIKRYITEVIAEDVEFLGGKKSAENDGRDTEHYDGVTPVENEDIPF